MIYIIIAYILGIILIIIDLIKQEKILNELKNELKFSRKSYQNLIDIYDHIIKISNKEKIKDYDNINNNENNKK